MHLRGKLLALLTLPSLACVSVRGVTRGELLDRNPVREEHTDRHIATIARDRASLETARRTCTTYRDRFAELQVQDVTHPSYFSLGTGLLLAGVGGGLLYYAATDDTESHGMEATPGEKALIFGVPLALVGTMMASMSAVDDNLETDRRLVPLDSNQTEDHVTCVDSRFPTKEAVSWDLALGSVHRTGTTDSDAALELLPAAVDVLKEAPLEAAADPLAMGQSLRLALTLGDADPATWEVRAPSVPREVWAKWFDDYERASLNGSRYLRRKACSALASSERGALECLWAKDDQDGRLFSFEGTLERTEAGDYGAAHDFAGAAGDRYTLRNLIPEKNADWLFQVVELDSGTVVAETFSGDTDEPELSWTLPRTGDYVLVLNALKPGRYWSVLTKGTR